MKNSTIIKNWLTYWSQANGLKADTVKCKEQASSSQLLPYKHMLMLIRSKSIYTTDMQRSIVFQRNHILDAAIRLFQIIYIYSFENNAVTPAIAHLQAGTADGSSAIHNNQTRRADGLTAGVPECCIIAN